MQGWNCAGSQAGGNPAKAGAGNPTANQSELEETAHELEEWMKEAAVPSR